MKPTKKPNKRHVPRQSGVGARQVLIPGTRKTAPSSWREHLHRAVAR